MLIPNSNLGLLTNARRIGRRVARSSKQRKLSENITHRHGKEIPDHVNSMV
jgi:hypothetical protein